LALAEDGVGLGEEFLRARFGEGPVAFAADREGSGWTPAASTADADDAGEDSGDDGAGWFVDWPKIVSSCGGRPTTVKRPDAVAVVDVFDLEHGKRRATVVAEVVAEGAFGEELIRNDGAATQKSVSHGWEAVGAGACGCGVAECRRMWLAHSFWQRQRQRASSRASRR
jgi:hypothetical protein